MWKHAAPVGTELEAQHLREPQRMHIHLPARRAVCQRRLFEDFSKHLACEMHLLTGPVGTRPIKPVLPLDVVPTVDADIEALVANAAHHVTSSPAYVRARQQRPVEQSFDAVVLDHRSPLHLAEKPGSKYPFDRTPGVIGS